MTTTNIVLTAIAVICVAGVAYSIYQSTHTTFNSDRTESLTDAALVLTVIFISNAIYAAGYNTWLHFFN